MQVSYRKLVGIPVKTHSGQPVGKLADVEIDTDTGRIEALLVRTSGFIRGLMHHELRIAWSQVISLSATEAIVTDAIVPVGATHVALGFVPPTMPGNATER